MEVSVARRAIVNVLRICLQIAVFDGKQNLKVSAANHSLRWVTKKAGQFYLFCFFDYLRC